MSSKRKVLFVAAICLAPMWALGANGQDLVAPLNSQQAEQSGDNPVLVLDRPAEEEPLQLVVRGQSSGYGSASVARFGWWGVDATGSPTKVGEWQGLEHSPFWDVDVLTSDGCRTIDASLTGTESEATDARVHYFGPRLTADVEYQRFIHRLTPKPLDAWFNSPNTSVLYADNFTDTTDHAIRVQELDASFKGHLTKNVTWGLDVWGMRKHGERQKMSMDHGCERGGSDPRGRGCHQVTTTQSIDWLTMEIKPYVEAQFGPVSAEYSRTMRALQQNDEVVSRSYGYTPDPGPPPFLDAHPNEIIDPTLQYPFGIVPDNYTQIDRLKLGVDVTENTRFYSLLYTGDTHNRYRDTNRGFWGMDFRLTNRTFCNLKLSAFAKRYEENNQFPTTFPEDGLFLYDPAQGIDDRPSSEVRHPVDRQYTKAGLSGRWKPFGRCHPLRGMAFTAGYEYQHIERQFVTYEILGGGDEPFIFTQPDTNSHIIKLGTDYRVSPCLDTFLRYKMVNNIDPLLGVRESDEATGDPDLDVSDIPALNTNQPNHIDRIEFGGTWTPTYNFLLSATIGLEQRSHFSEAADFDEQDYPLIFTAWYAPTCRWSISGGMAFYSNWIDQRITFGNRHQSRRGDEPQDTQDVDYGGRADVLSLGTAYQCTDRLSLRGEVEWVRGSNVWTVPSPAGADWSALPGFSSVIVEKTQFTAGLDYLLTDRIGAYVQYVYFDYRDELDTFNSGTAHMILGGMSATF